jgi:hypothetical protein
LADTVIQEGIIKMAKAKKKPRLRCWGFCGESGIISLLGLL